MNHLRCQKKIISKFFFFSFKYMGFHGNGKEKEQEKDSRRLVLGLT